MKITSKYIITAGIILIAFLLIFNIIRSYKIKKEAEARIQTLQHYCLESLFGVQTCVDEFNPDLATFILYFHPECEYCQNEAKEIGFNAQNFTYSNFIMITPDDSIRRVEKFITDNGLWEIDNISVLLDTENNFEYYFGTSVLPTTFIYKNNKLLKKFSGETKTEALLKYINH